MTVKQVKAAIAKHEQNVQAFYDDPMTEYCPCVSDFAEDFDRKLRKLAHELYRAASAENDAEALDTASGMLEQWMP